MQEKLFTKIIKISDEILPKAWEMAHAIFKRPELGYQEFFALETLTGFLGDRGFKIEKGVAGIETAFVASRGRGKPEVAFLAEMDALPVVGHACGHHLIAASSTAAGAVLAEALEPLKGTVKVIGTPAEEGGGGKVFMADAGIFDGLDAAFIVHPDRRTEVYKRSLGVVEIELIFKGRAAHAAAYPEDGVNALDAMIQTYNAINALRQQLTPGARIHGIIVDGGKAANIIPDYTRAMFMARGSTLAETVAVAKKLLACARGAATATGCKLSYKMKKDVMYAPYIPNRKLGEVYWKALDRLGIPVEQTEEDQGIGSTDVGNACLRAPLLHPLMTVPGAVEGVHSESFAKIAGGEGGREMLGGAIKSLALAGADVMLDEKLRKEIHREHAQMVKSQTSPAG